MSDDRRGPSELEIGSVFAGFRIEAMLGRGGMGSVYRARDLALDHERALKVLDPALARDRAFRERFQRESRLAAGVDHPAVVPVYRAGEEDGRLFIAMRLVRGPDLHRLVETDGPLEPQRTARLVGMVASALDAAHARGIVHRDVKPANILIELGTDGERVFLGDFGISRAPGTTAALTSTGQLLGTPDYISPEQIEGRAPDARSDVYALGCVVSFLLTGEPPFARENEMATLYAHANAARPRPSLLQPSLPAGVDDVVGRATAIDPAERQPSAGALAAELHAAVTPGPSKAGTGEAATAVVTRPRRSRRRPWIAAAAAVLALVAAGLVAILAGGGDADDDPGAESPGGGSAPETRTFTSVEGDPVDALVVGEVNVLAAAQAASALHAVDPASGQPARAPTVLPGPSSVAVGFGSVWVSSAAQDQVLRFGPPDRDVAEPIAVGAGPADLAVDEQAVWVANRGDASVSRINPFSKRVSAEIPVSASPEAIAAGNGAVWVASPAAGAVVRIDAVDPSTQAQPIELGGRPTDLVVDGELTWVVDPERGTLTRLSAQGDVVERPLTLGGSPVAVAAGLGAIWVADRAAGEVVEVDPATAQIRERIGAGKGPVALAVGDESVWVADKRGGTLTRITP